MKKGVSLVLRAVPLISLFAAYLVLYSAGAFPEALGLRGFTAIMVFFAIIYMWAVELLPLPVTAFIAILLLAASGCVSVPDSLYGFGSTSVFLIIIGFFLAAGLMASGLDRRMAYAILRRSHTERSVLFGIIFMTSFLSMIISNTTTTLLMLPIAIHIMREVRMNKEALLLGVAFAANIGGVGLMIGTPPNIMASQAMGWSFYDWMIPGFPFAIIMTILLYVSFLVYFRPEGHKIKKHLLKDLGPITRKEKATAAIIIISLALWLTEPLHGLNTIVIGLLSGLLMFIFVYDWRYFERKTEWGTIILIAGAVSIGYALDITGAAGWIAKSFITMTGFTNPLLIVFSFVLLALAITQFIQNTAVAAMFIPVLAGLSDTMGIAKPLLIFPVAVAVSMTFLMPPGTAPNAIVHSAGRIKTKDMIKAGALPTLFAVVLLFFYVLLMA